MRYSRIISAQPMLYLITSPSRRTYLVGDTPTLVVCGAPGLPVSAPTEFSGDQGPVQATTTPIRMTNGTSERITRIDGLPVSQPACAVPGSPPARPGASAACSPYALTSSALSSRPPKPS